jgi:hypothetical protein
VCPRSLLCPGSQADDAVLVGVIGLFIGLAWVFFCMRMYVRIFLTKGFGVDDIFLIIAIVGSPGREGSCLASSDWAQIIYTTYCTCAGLGAKHGTGRHLPAIPPQDIPQALHWWFLCEYGPISMVVRVNN